MHSDDFKKSKSGPKMPYSKCTDWICTTCTYCSCHPKPPVTQWGGVVLNFPPHRGSKWEPLCVSIHSRWSPRSRVLEFNGPPGSSARFSIRYPQSVSPCVSASPEQESTPTSLLSSLFCLSSVLRPIATPRSARRAALDQSSIHNVFKLDCRF